MISVAHSPDSDDELLFWALKHGKIATGELEFSFAAHDTHELNRRAEQGLDDVTAISAASYPQLHNTYAILPYGACFGKDYGPVVVAPTPFDVSELNHMHIGIPGRSTTAAAILRLIAPNARLTEIPIKPYRAVFEALSSGKLDAALLIHEGQLEHSHFGLHVIVDCGKWWLKETGFILPLGLNIIKRSLGTELTSRVVSLIGQSTEWGLEHRDEILPTLMALGNTRGATTLSDNEMRLYLDRYAGEDSRGLDNEKLSALHELFRRTSSLSGNLDVLGCDR